MRRSTPHAAWATALLLLIGGGPLAFADVVDPTPASVAGVNPQCPGDTDGDAIPEPGAPDYDPNVMCMHLAAGDGYSQMADGRLQYMFGFGDVTGILAEDVIQDGTLAAQWSAPTIVMKEGTDFYLSLTNVGMQIRPDLFDPHTVHFHGFPQASAIYDGLPETGVSINMGSTLTYFYHLEEPGTHMYHCHVEATEHMQMGMLGNLYVLPAQNDLPNNTLLGGFTHHTGYTYAYNDGDGSTFYDVDYPLQFGSFDGEFHDASESVQPLPFAEMRAKYAMLNGRGYPDTVFDGDIVNPETGSSQKIPSKIVVEQGQRALLRISSLDVVREYTVSILGIPMRVIGKDARILRSVKTGENLYFETSSITLGGGSTVDVLLDLDTYDIPEGVYPLYATNLNYLSNDAQDFGGLMTEVHVVAP